MSQINTKKSYKSLFFKNDKLPFVESRLMVNSKYQYEKHFHTTLSIGAIEEGEVNYLHKTDNYTLKPKQLCLIEPNIIHCCNPTKNSSRTYHMLYIDTNWCKQLQSKVFQEVNSYLSVQKIQIDDEDLYEKYLQLNYSLLDENIFYLQKEELLEEFFIELFTTYCTKNSKKTIKYTTSKIEEKLIKAKDFIEKNCKENLTLDEISEATSLSKFYLVRVFKEHLHTTPYKYLLNCKINLAKELLSKDFESKEVCYEVGFFDQSHFSKVFKKYVAVSPNEYKNNTII